MAMDASLPCGPGIALPKGPNDAKYVENVMEHAFLSAMLEHCWFIRRYPVEVVRPDVDAGGYDLVLEAKERVRHVQLKSRWERAAGPKLLRINSRLAVHRDPCVVRIFWQVDPECHITLKYKYSEKMRSHPEVPGWPEPVPEEATFELKWAHFLPGYLDISALVDLLFEPATTL